MDYSTLTEMFLQVTSQYSDKALYHEKINDHWQGLRGKDIRDTVEDLAYALRSLGIAKGTQAAILSNNSPRWAMSDYAILCAGATTVAIYPVLPAPQVAYILKHSSASLVFVENIEQGDKVLEIWDDCPELKTLVVMNGAELAGPDLDPDRQRIVKFMDVLELGHEYAQETDLDFEAMCKEPQPDDLLTLIYTSGTTGEPKGVMLTHNNLVTNIKAALTHIQITSEDSLLSFLPLAHSFERMAGHFLAFSMGAAVYYAESIEKVALNLQETRPTVLLGAPRFYEKVYNRVIESVSQSPALRQKIFWWAIGLGKAVSQITQNGGQPGGWLAWKYRLATKLVFSKLQSRVGGRIRFFVSGSAPLSADIAEFFAAAGMIILEGYGLTETSPALTVNKLEKFKYGKVGPAIPGIEMKIADDGEILARGPNIMKGYFKDEAATAEAIDDDGWFHTGDIGAFDEDGYLKITDRKKNMIVTSGGKNVAPAGLENALVIQPHIEQVCIIGDQRNFVSALIVPTYDSLQTYAQERGLEISGTKELVEHPEIIALVEKEVEAAMTAFARYEQIRKIVLLPVEFTIDGGELTPTLKVKRKVVLDRYSDIIENIYSGAIADAPAI